MELGGLHLSICKDPLLNEFLIDFMCEYLSRPLKVRKRGCYNDRSGLLSVHYRYPPSPKLLMRNRVLNTFFLTAALLRLAFLAGKTCSLFYHLLNRSAHFRQCIRVGFFIYDPIMLSRKNKRGAWILRIF